MGDSSQGDIRLCRLAKLLVLYGRQGIYGRALALDSASGKKCGVGLLAWWRCMKIICADVAFSALEKYGVNATMMGSPEKSW
ncbi:hypothetical protein HSX11_03715 [Oxalobacteraceae bacterium]|nr:hypothetical protein [Oxalobacteraceae bacterium]